MAMDYFNLSAKTLQRKLMGSLSRRIFYIAFFLLVIPLFFHTIFMYRSDYKLKIQDLFVHIAILGESQANNVNQKVEHKEKTLDEIAEKINFEEEATTNFFDNDVNTLLQFIQEVSVAKELFYLSYKTENNLLCTASASKEQLGENFATRKNFYDALKTQRSYFLGPNRNLFYLTKTIMSKKTNTAAGVLVIAFEASYFVQEISFIKDFPYKVEVSVISQEGKIVASSNQKLFDQYLGQSIKLEPVPYLSDGYVLDIDGSQHMAAKVPIGKLPAYLLIDVMQQDIIAGQRRNYFLHFATLFLFLLLIGGGGCWWLTRRISLPLNHLVETMSLVAKGDVRKKYVPDKMGFEINFLGCFFNHVIESMLRNQKEAEKQKMEKQIFAQELKLGHEIQREMLPIQHPDFPALDIAAEYIPAKEVSGDFYDLFKIDEDQLMIVIADTAGKGISACFYSLNIRSLFRSFAVSKMSLEEIMQNTNKLFCQDAKDTGMFVTAWIGIYNKNTRNITYASAGHWPAIVKRKNKLMELNNPNIAFGVDEEKPIKTESFQLEQEDFLLLYTDGIIETHNDLQELYGKERLKDCFFHMKTQDAHETVKEIIDDINEFSSGKEQFDDITLVAVHLL